MRYFLKKRKRIEEMNTAHTLFLWQGRSNFLFPSFTGPHLRTNWRFRIWSGLICVRLYIKGL
jgi:hypothetical protein